MALKVGDIVQLKSGGPKMTVKSSHGVEDDVHCQWFAGSKLEEGWFPPDSVVTVPPDAGGQTKK
jgi:uncharacterized protein YodC (DUF2158 family)